MPRFTACVTALVWLRAAAVTGKCTPRAGPDRMIIIDAPAAPPYYSWQQCNSKGHPTRSINETERRAPVHLLDLQGCNLDCLDPDSFAFPGANNVTAINLDSNNFVALPEALLWNVPNLLNIDLNQLKNLANLPAKFFQNQSKLTHILINAASVLGAQERLPDELFRGLSTLEVLWITASATPNLPSMADLTALKQLAIVGVPNPGSPFYLDAEESETAFDGLANLESIQAQSNSLTRVFSLKDLGRLRDLNLVSNRITKIWPHDFAGAAQLVMLNLGSNHIVSVAVEVSTASPNTKLLS